MVRTSPHGFRLAGIGSMHLRLRSPRTRGILLLSDRPMRIPRFCAALLVQPGAGSRRRAAQTPRMVIHAVAKRSVGRSRCILARTAASDVTQIASLL